MCFNFLILHGLAAIAAILAYKSVCATPQLSNNARIVGGFDATQGQIPYIVVLCKGNVFSCGGSIIEVSGVILVITAAHCVVGIEPEDILLVAGDLNLNDTTGIEQYRNITKIVVHEEFVEETFHNDIALLFLDKPFEFNENVKPIALPEQGKPVSGKLLVAGWGKLKYYGHFANTLQMVEVPLVDNEICAEKYIEHQPIYETEICAGFLDEGGKDACSGDSGGPAVSIDEGYLAGLVSFGEGCAQSEYPGVYLKVSEYVDWITHTVANNAQ